ncbi:hypothetical protein C8R45DRAFT_946105 [Mycena sanguinolenta]|nr:hypothetical protein C8R45DRAFT_946105 [Mycena sanguinolenta]
MDHGIHQIRITGSTGSKQSHGRNPSAIGFQRDMEYYKTYRAKYYIYGSENVTEGQIHRDAFDAFNATLEEKVLEMVTTWKAWVHQWESVMPVHFPQLSGFSRHFRLLVYPEAFLYSSGCLIINVLCLRIAPSSDLSLRGVVSDLPSTFRPFRFPAFRPSGLPSFRPSVLPVLDTDITESQQHADGTESPFEVQEKVTTMKDIKLRIAKEELLKSGEGVEVEREDTPSTFIMMGLEIEESQQLLAVDVKAITNATPQQEHDFLKCRPAIRKCTVAFRKLQHAYMPHVRKFLTISQQALWDADGERDAEAICLFLPFDITDSTKRVKACAEGLPEVEASLQEGEAHDALEGLRQGLRVLQDEDIQALNERVVTAEERAQQEAVHNLRDVEEGGVGDYGVVALGERRRTLSWIWYTTKADDPSEQELVEALRVERCKAYARMRRWHEDVVLVEEEMRQTIQYGYWEAGQWLERSVAWDSLVDAVLQDGLKAYALEQGHREAKTCDALKAKWAFWRERGALFGAGNAGKQCNSA